MALVGTRSREVCVIFDSLRALGTSEGRLRLAKLRGSTFRRVPWERCKARRKRGLPAAVLFIQAYPGAGIGPGAMPAPESGERGPQRMNSPEGALAVSWLMAQKGRVVLGQHRDPDGKNYAALWLTGAK